MKRTDSAYRDVTDQETRDRVWFVLREGRRVLLLEDAQQEDMFWYSFRTVALIPNGLDGDLGTLWDRALEVEDPRMGYRYGGVIAGEVRPKEPGDRVWLRGIVVKVTKEKPRRWWPSWWRG